ncbi:MAG: hypothetical protein M0R33_15535 [Methylomonas sp.]|jgi:hypothetical protein|uniref:hypothetical protein n=1 Tax=Methylomonas sp. TaxID=418 RepID=UPI0025F6813F|nr:hypothetical protein [Methylomonas sp.]MCK9607855.1 hypothetical protein [Methylomonas sp.]
MATKKYHHSGRVGKISIDETLSPWTYITVKLTQYYEEKNRGFIFDWSNPQIIRIEEQFVFIGKIPVINCETGDIFEIAFRITR